MRRAIIENKGQRGIALVLVLSVLALITVLILAFFITVNGQYNRSQIYARNNAIQQLSDVAVRIVMSQIKQATSNGTGIAWASQPGMIRTFGNADGTASSSRLTYYKLYSSDKMQLGASDILSWTATSSSCTDLPTDSSWPTSEPALYTDLNSPILQNGTAHFPIFDPNAEGVVKGFPAPATVAANNQISTAMPVKWLYLLQDGSLIAPDSTSTTLATFTGASVQPSSSNPIIGRVAFWTDDDTCKLDINTAAGTDWTTATTPATKTSSNSGSYWSPPVTDTYFDRTLGSCQPVAGEYQRYPGHPATTLLSAVFPTLTSAQIYSLIPRITSGGSNGGTTAISSSSTSIQTDQDRLYSSVDDLVFTPARTASSGLTAAQVEQSRFFLTTRSEAPELNLYNLPRISMWPVWSTASQRTVYDNLSALCSTFGGSSTSAGFPYYIQRSDPMSSTTDLPTTSSTSGLGRNRGLLEYLRKLTSLPVPGFGGTFASKYSATDANPGSSKITGTERDQILTEIFDYIRNTNIFDPTASSGNVYSPSGLLMPTLDSTNGTQGFGRWPVVTEAGLVFIGIGDQYNVSPDSRDSADGPIPPGKISIRAGFLMNAFMPADGFPVLPTSATQPTYTVKVTGLNALKWTDSSVGIPQSMGFPATITENVTFPGPSGRVGGLRLLDLDPSPYLFSTPHTLIVTSGGTINFTFDTSVASAITVVWTGKTNPTSNSPPPSVSFTMPNGTFPTPKLAPLANIKNSSGTVIGQTNTALFSNRHGVNNKNDDFWSQSQDVIRTVTDNVPNGVNYDHRLVCGRHVVTPVDGLFGAAPQYSSPTYTMGTSLNDGLFLFQGTQYGCYAPNVLNMGANAYYAGFPDTSSSSLTTTATSTLVPTAGNGVDANGCITITIVPDPHGQNRPSANTFNEQRFSYLHQIAPGQFAYLFGSSTVLGDWDNGTGNNADGPYINKADEGSIYDTSTDRVLPYYSSLTYLSNPTATYFIPNREVPSSMMLGSLSTGVVHKHPWQTLLFRPGPTGHPGLASPPDHLIADLFNMPIVQPYAISEPLATSGKLNMNYEIVPFTYITRSTGIQAVLASEQIVAIPNSQSVVYKTEGSSGRQTTFRYLINLNETLGGFTDRFDSNDIFRSATEICSLWLVPQDGSSTYAGNFKGSQGDTWWSGYALTGDNSRERPYVDIYPRLTTKSNTYTVHYKVQALQKLTSTVSNPTNWNETSDLILGELRGSTSIERYIDTNDPKLSDSTYDPVTQAAIGTPTALDNFYKFRVLATRRFSVSGQ